MHRINFYRRLPSGNTNSNLVRNGGMEAQRNGIIIITLNLYDKTASDA